MLKIRISARLFIHPMVLTYDIQGLTVSNDDFPLLILVNESVGTFFLN